jgi:hypothetical protein
VGQAYPPPGPLRKSVRNFRERDQRHRIKICTPPGITAKPPVLEGMVSSRPRVSFPLRLYAKRDARPGVHIVAFDITLDGQRYGQWFDFVARVARPTEPPGR